MVNVPNSSGVTSFEMMDRMAMNDVPLMMSTIGAENGEESFAILVI